MKMDSTDSSSAEILAEFLVSTDNVQQLDVMMKSDSKSFPTSSITEEDVVVSTELVEEYNVNAEDLKYLHKSAEYKLHKPTVRDSLYFLIMESGDDEKKLEQFTKIWSRCYQQPGEAANAFYLIYQLVLDIMGYHEVIIINEKSKLDKSFTHLKTILETTSEDKHHKFILKGNTKCFKTISKIYFKFLEKWIFTCFNRNILHEQRFSDFLLKFIESLIGSKNYIIKFNLLVFTSKLITNIVATQGLQDNKRNCKPNLLLDALNRYFWTELIYSNNDGRMDNMKLIVIFDIQYCLQHYPLYFNKSSLVKTLKLFLLDCNYLVRYWAIRLSTILVIAEETDKIFNENLSLIIAGRLLDEKEEVRLNSVKYFIQFVSRFPGDLPTQVLEYMKLGIAAKSYNLAEQCVLFNDAYMGKAKTDPWEKIFLLATTTEIAKHRKLIVPACLELYPDLKNIEPLLETISSDLEEETLNSWLEILYYIAKYLLTGENDFKLHNQPFNVNIIENKKSFSNSLLPCVLTLLNMIEMYSISLHWFLKTLDLIHFKDTNDAVNNIHIETINEKIINLLTKAKDSETIKLIGKVILKLKEGHLGHTISTFFEKLKEEFLQVSDIVFKTSSFKELSEDIYLKYSYTLRLISNLFEFYDFTNDIEFNKLLFHLEDNEMNITQSDMVLIKYQLAISRWYLIWRFKNIFQVKPSDTLLQDFYDKVGKFYWYCLKLFSKLISYETQLAAYFELCGFLIDIKNYLKEVNQYKFKLNISLNVSLVHEINKFVRTVCFERRSDTIRNEERILRDYFSVLIHGHIDIRNIVDILEYFVDFKNDYKKIYDSMFSFLLENDPEEAFTSITLLTIITSFKKRGATNLKYVQELSNDLFLYVPKILRETCVDMAINYVLNEPESAEFLPVLKPLILRLNLKEKEACYTKTVDLIQRRNLQGCVSIQHFIRFLKDEKYTKK